MARKGLGTGTVLLIIIALVGVIYAQSKGWINFTLPFSTVGTETGLVDVNKQLKWTLIDKYAGSAVAQGSNILSIYDSDGMTLLESNLDTDANGQGNSAFSYSSGKSVYFKLDNSNVHQWFQLTVPKMNEKDAESATYNLIELRTFSIGTYSTDSFKCQNGTTIADAGTYNTTTSGTTMTFTYSLADTGSDNTGLMTSFDPLYDCNYNIVLYAVVSGTGYEKILFYGFEKDYTLGTTHYLASNLDAYKLTKYKVGNTYLSTGAQDFTFSIDATGYTTSGPVTLQIYAYAYSDYNYAAAHGQNYGPMNVQIAEQTISITK